MKEYTEEAEKYGIKLFMPCSIIGTADKDIMRVGRSVLEAIGNTSVIAWYIADDTVNHSTATELKVRNNAVKAVDPSRLTVHADGVSIVTHKISRLPYMNHADIFMPEIYPVYGNEKDVHCVAQVYADMETARREISSVATGRKGIWAIIQYFKGEKWARYPSPLQLRAMSYAALVAGAQGLIWYTYPDLIRTPKRTIFGAAHSAENWKIMTDVSKQISALGEVLAEYTEKTPVLTVISGPSRDSLGNSSVRCIMKKHKNQNYLIAVNSTLEDVAASFEVPDCKEGTVLHEDRRITMQNGKFTDKFGPYGVHVYLLK